MKHTNIFSRWICLVMLQGCVGVSWGQNLTTLNNSGTWNGGTLTKNITVELTGDVTLNSRIIIPEGKTLTIQLADNVTESVSITNGASALNQMFYIRSGGTLIIKGRNRNNMDDHLYVIIDGGAKFGDWSDQSPYLTQGTGGLAMTKANSSDNASAIWNRGTLSMKYAKIQNVYVKDEADSGGAIYINSGEGKVNGPTTIEDCIIEKCKTVHGSALHITTQGTDKKPETCAVTIENSIIRYCYATAQDNDYIQGGTIRTNGKAVSNLNLKNVSFINNYSEGNGGAVYWNGGGHKDTKCTIDGCSFEGNRAEKKGGALFLETTFEFVNNLTTVRGNFAGERGGGVCVNGYNGGAIPSGDFIFNLGENLKVVDNESGTGGGISFHFEKMSFTETSSLTAKVNGVHVEGNTATTNGGGIHLNNTSASAENAATIDISILLDKGNILKNEAGEDGGGIYVAQTNISHTSENNETLTMQGNVATKNGGALFLNDGNLDLGNIEMKKNIAKENGGGICLADGALSMKEGSEIVENSAAEKGGGMYVYNESPQTNKVQFSGGTLSNNTAKLGGGICVEGLINLTTDNTSIECNQAVNGGAICMINSNKTQSVMTFGSGLIRNNVATSDDVYPCSVENEGSTAKGKSAEDVVGVGGGVFLDSNTKLNFGTGKTFGFYGNLATNVADDIFA